MRLSCCTLVVIIVPSLVVLGIYSPLKERVKARTVKTNLGKMISLLLFELQSKYIYALIHP